VDLGAYGMVYDERTATPVSTGLLGLHAQRTVKVGTASREKGQTAKLPGGPIKIAGWGMNCQVRENARGAYTYVVEVGIA
jgi:hypothetical protein